MGDKGPSDGVTRALAEVAVEPQQGAADSLALCIQAVGEGRGQQHRREFLAEILDVDVWAGGAQLQYERHVRRLSGEHERMADLIPQLDSDGGIDLETLAPLAPGGGGDVALGLDAGKPVGRRIVVHRRCGS